MEMEVCKNRIFIQASTLFSYKTVLEEAMVEEF